MKKLVLAASMLAASFGVFAQDYKPVAGNVTTELGLSLFGTGFQDQPFSSFQGNFGNNGLMRFRYFLQDQLAVRVGFNYSMFTETNKQTSTASGAIDFKETFKSSLFGLNLGLEKHLTGTDRLSTYVGGDIMLNFLGASAKGEKINLAGAQADNNSYEIKGWNNGGRNGGNDINAGFGLGLRAVVGADYYFAEKAYVGMELGYGFVSYSYKGYTQNSTTGGTAAPEVKVGKNGGEFQLTPAAQASLRIGFRF